MFQIIQYEKKIKYLKKLLHFSLFIENFFILLFGNWIESITKSFEFKFFILNIIFETILKTIFMKNFTTYLSTAPVVALAWFTVTAALLIEINRFFPDPLVFSF